MNYNIIRTLKRARKTEDKHMLRHGRRRWYQKISGNFQGWSSITIMQNCQILLKKCNIFGPAIKSGYNSDNQLRRQTPNQKPIENLCARSMLTKKAAEKFIIHTFRKQGSRLLDVSPHATGCANSSRQDNYKTLVQNLRICHMTLPVMTCFMILQSYFHLYIYTWQ